jgi:uncharacterized membrane protein YphA (DoxX/SURF4 family)
MIVILRLILGGIFLATGISKIPIFDAFAYSITELIPLSGTTLTATAVATIAFEITAGIALLFNKGTRLFSALLSLMLFMFIIALSGALFRYEYYICTCFGVLGLELPVNQQIVLDFVLLNMAVLVFIFSSTDSKSTARIQQRTSRIIVPLLVISIIWSAIVLTQPRLVFGSRPAISIDAHKVFKSIPNTESFHPRLVFMIDIADFLCPQCLDDFVDMANRITGDFDDRSRYVHIFVKRVEFMDDDELRAYIEDWRWTHRYPLEMLIDTDNIFTQAGFDKSTALLYSGLGSLEDIETFPMGSRRRTEIIDRFLR